MSTLTLDRVSKSFGKAQVLRSISFECKNGEFLAIVGPSGSGKTVTLNCIAGFEYPEVGSIYFDDQDVTMLPPQDRNVAMVFESYALYPHFTVRNNLAFPLRSPRYRLPEKEIESRIERVAKVLNVEGLLDRFPRQLSQGQRQRVSLGRALVREPRMFLFDEPISHLDAKLRNAMRRELKRMRMSMQQTSVYVTHDYLEALSLADRVVVINKGELVQFAPSREVYNHPGAVEAGQLFGSPPMMFFDGKIGEGYCFVPDGASFRLDTHGTDSQLATGQEVILGLRASDLAVCEPTKGHVQGEVYSVQNQFDRQLITVKSNGYLIDILTPENTSIAEGDKVGVRIPVEVCHYFDKTTHRAL